MNLSEFGKYLISWHSQRPNIAYSETKIFDKYFEQLFKKEYDPEMNLEQGMKLAVSAFKTVFGKEFDVERIDGAYIKTSDKLFRRLDKEYLRKLAKKV